ncbi:MAG: XdhC family protein [Hasllibacter sp.]
MNTIPQTALRWHREGRGAALAHVVSTWGSAPVPAGSMLAVAGDGEMAGSVSGGCVEGAVVLEAQDALADGKPRILDYGVADEDAFAVGLACGGRIRVLVEPVGAALPEGVLADLVDRAGQGVGYRVDLSTWDRRLLDRADAPGAFAQDRSGEEDGVFTLILNPPLRLAIVGGVHIAQALVPMARIAGYAPTVIDPREAFASGARFPGTALSHDWPDAAMEAFAPDARTAVVLLTHDPKLDDPALIRALGGPAFYVGALGSTRTHAKRVERLRAAGVPDDAIARIDAPVGLDIGARGPSEIAVSILAAMTKALRAP